MNCECICGCIAQNYEHAEQICVLCRIGMHKDTDLEAMAE